MIQLDSKRLSDSAEKHQHTNNFEGCFSCVTY